MNHTSEIAKKQKKIMMNLKKKDVVYTEADKGNKLVIMNKSDYENRVIDLIEKCQYKKVPKCPLPKLIR